MKKGDAKEVMARHRVHIIFNMGVPNASGEKAEVLQKFFDRLREY